VEEHKKETAAGYHKLYTHRCRGQSISWQREIYPCLNGCYASEFIREVRVLPAKQWVFIHSEGTYSTALAQLTTKVFCSCCVSSVRDLASTTVNLTAVLRVLSQRSQLNAWIGASNRPRPLSSQSVLTHRRCVAGVSSQTSIGTRTLGARFGKSHAFITYCTFALY